MADSFIQDMRGYFRAARIIGIKEAVLAIDTMALAQHQRVKAAAGTPDFLQEMAKFEMAQDAALAVYRLLTEGGVSHDY